ncbi:uncharacterized protein RCC_06811 [Ramularia collo-cygni]|uniref:RNase III domain-containing protein n=1 Tax=Ramularia collo-cygni TaxID=112498 RepID=A0A2D3V687_9PEZI|nr:uncharacterized protein RCC_06811 [Ramularia collo-cygni]CZT20950.1 uncharacterized protein RCC_06811 [Ramularia collo-cygni]
MAASAKVQQAQAFITESFGYSIQDAALVHEAIDTTGLCRIYSTEANKRLAMVGDKALESTIISAWYPTGAPRGECSSQVQTRLRNENLADVAETLGLDRYLILHPGQLGRVSRKTLATGLEAIFGAIYRDSGEQISVVREAMDFVGI